MIDNAFKTKVIYLSPILDFGLGDVLDGHLKAVSVADASVDDAEAALAQDVPDLVGLFEGLSRNGGRARWGRMNAVGNNDHAYKKINRDASIGA